MQPIDSHVLKDLDDELERDAELTAFRKRQMAHACPPEKLFCEPDEQKLWDRVVLAKIQTMSADEAAAVAKQVIVARRNNTVQVYDGNVGRPDPSLFVVNHSVPRGVCG